MYMEIIKVDKLSISECCKQLDIEREKLPESLHGISGSQSVIDRLNSLIDADRIAFKSCSTIEQYENYLDVHHDGLYRYDAIARITCLKNIARAEEEELFFSMNKLSRKGCEMYLRKYPYGAFTAEANSIIESLNRKCKKRIMICSIVLILISLIVLYIGYSPSSIILSEQKLDNESSTEIEISPFKASLPYVSLIEVLMSGLHSDDIKVLKFSEIGGSQTLSISANNKVDVKCSHEWFSAELKSGSLIINVTKNPFPIRTGTITLTTSSTLFGKVISSQKKYIRIEQKSGEIIASKLEIYEDFLLIQESGTYKGESFHIKIDTDGSYWTIKSAPSWIQTRLLLNNKIIEVTADKNEGFVKEGEIIVASNNPSIDNKSIRIVQIGDPNNFEAEKKSIKFGISRDYEYVTIYNDSHKQPSISESENWISTDVIDNNRIKISCNRNYDEPPRSANVFVHCGNSSIKIKVMQDGWEDCATCNGEGEIPCPNEGRSSYPQWAFLYEDGIHYLVYYPWAMGVASSMKKYEICKTCGGSGYVDCHDCDNGKVVSRW